jgi:hypothetical protein
MKEPFTEKEQEVMDLILLAHSKFSELERTHTMEMPEWVSGVLQLEHLLGMRTLRRDYPKHFITMKE